MRERDWRGSGRRERRREREREAERREESRGRERGGGREGSREERKRREREREEERRERRWERREEGKGLSFFCFGGGGWEGGEEREESLRLALAEAEESMVLSGFGFHRGSARTPRGASCAMNLRPVRGSGFWFLFFKLFFYIKIRETIELGV